MSHSPSIRKFTIVLFLILNILDILLCLFLDFLKFEFFESTTVVHIGYSDIDRGFIEN